MNRASNSANGSCGCYGGEERRQKMRVCEIFFAKVQGADPRGNPFEIAAVLENLSTSGLYMRIAQKVQEGDKLSIRIKLPPVSDLTAPGLDVAAEGEVLRVDRLEKDSFAVAVRFTRHRVL
jgi:hypothetical protein